MTHQEAQGHGLKRFEIGDSPVQCNGGEQKGKWGGGSGKKTSMKRES